MVLVGWLHNRKNFPDGCGANQRVIKVFRQQQQNPSGERDPETTTLLQNNSTGELFKFLCVPTNTVCIFLTPSPPSPAGRPIQTPRIKELLFPNISHRIDVASAPSEIVISINHYLTPRQQNVTKSDKYKSLTVLNTFTLSHPSRSILLLIAPRMNFPLDLFNADFILLHVDSPKVSHKNLCSSGSIDKYLEGLPGWVGKSGLCILRCHCVIKNNVAGITK